MPVLDFPIGIKWALQWRNWRWAGCSQLLLSWWVLHLLQLVPQLWVSTYQLQCGMLYYLSVNLLLILICIYYSNPRSGCKNSMNHLAEGVCHEAKHRCRYSVQYDNRIYTCKVSREVHLWTEHSLFTSDTAITHHVPLLMNPKLKSILGVSPQACYEGGKEVLVVPKTSASSDSPWLGLAKYAWSGWVAGEWPTGSRCNWAWVRFMLPFHTA